MTVLILAAVIIIAISVWLLARPLKQSMANNEMAARLHQYVMSRQRLLDSLDNIEEQKNSGSMSNEVADDEIARLELELADILKQIDTCQDASTDTPVEQGEQRLRWLVAVFSFALILPIISLLVYVSDHTETLLQLASGNIQTMPTNHPVANPAQAGAGQFPPEVMQMVKRLEDKLEQNPDDGTGWKRLGRSYQVMGRLGESRTAYERAAALLPDDADVKQALVDLANVSPSAAPASPPAQAGDKPNFPPQVLAMVQQLEGKLKANPDDGDGWKRLGRAYTVMKRYSEAVSAYTSAAEILPQDKDIQRALQQLAQIASSRGNHPEEAEAEEGENKSRAAHGNIPKDILKRVLALEQKTSESPKDPKLWAGLGGVYMEMRRSDDAIRAFKQAVALAPEDAEILAGYAEAVFTSDPRDPDGTAMDLYRKLHKLDSQHPDGLWFLGLAAYSEGNPGGALDYWGRLLQVLPPQSEASRSVRQAIARLEGLLNQNK